MKPFEDAKEAADYVECFEGKAADLRLPVSDDLHDPLGLSMALITDKIFSKGWEPNGYEEKEGYRVYRYKEMQ